MKNNSFVSLFTCIGQRIQAWNKKRKRLSLHLHLRAITPCQLMRSPIVCCLGISEKIQFRTSSHGNVVMSQIHFHRKQLAVTFIHMWSTLAAWWTDFSPTCAVQEKKFSLKPNFHSNTVVSLLWVEIPFKSLMYFSTNKYSCLDYFSVCGPTCPAGTDSFPSATCGSPAGETEQRKPPCNQKVVILPSDKLLYNAMWY